MNYIYLRCVGGCKVDLVGYSGPKSEPITGMADGYYLCKECEDKGHTIPEKGFWSFAQKESDILNNFNQGPDVLSPIFYSNWEKHSGG